MTLTIGLNYFSQLTKVITTETIIADIIINCFTVLRSSFLSRGGGGGSLLEVRT